MSAKLVPHEARPLHARLYMATLNTEKLDSGEKVVVENQDDLAHRVEKVTASLPSTTWLTLAGASFVSSLALKLLGRQHLSLFVGQLTPTFLVLGLYNKLTKVGAATALLSSRR